MFFRQSREILLHASPCSSRSWRRWDDGDRYRAARASRNEDLAAAAVGRHLRCSTFRADGRCRAISPTVSHLKGAGRDTDCPCAPAVFLAGAHADVSGVLFCCIRMPCCTCPRSSRAWKPKRGPIWRCWPGACRRHCSTVRSMRSANALRAAAPALGADLAGGACTGVLAGVGDRPGRWRRAWRSAAVSRTHWSAGSRCCAEPPLQLRQGVGGLPAAASLAAAHPADLWDLVRLGRPWGSPILLRFRRLR